MKEKLLTQEICIYMVYLAEYMNQEHISLVCKHKHMLTNGAPPDIFRVL